MSFYKLGCRLEVLDQSLFIFNTLVATMFHHLFSTVILNALCVTQSLASPTIPGKQTPRQAAAGITGEQAAQDPRSAFFRQLVGASEYCNHQKTPTPSGVPLKVGIVGGGAAGLYAAILLDSLGIDYDIHEASGRIGGRIYTYYFDEKAWAASTPQDPEYYNYYVSAESHAAGLYGLD